jgi:hypothetical protein
MQHLLKNSSTVFPAISIQEAETCSVSFEAQVFFNYLMLVGGNF